MSNAEEVVFLSRLWWLLLKFLKWCWV